jgi:hypothetical protein
VTEVQRALRDDAIWSISQASAAAAVAAGCAASPPIAEHMRTAPPPLDNLLADDEPFPANCGSSLEEDGPGGLAAVCATVRAGAVHPRTREVLIAISNRNILPMLSLYMEGVRRAAI